jgi:branched-chain amino acid transport system permease protein
MLLFLKQLVNGIQVGSIYALVALGYTMVYGIAQLINFAHGDFIMVGAYIALLTGASFAAYGIPVWLCVIPAILGTMLIGVLSERIAYKPLRGSPRISVLITAIGVSLFLENLAMLIFTPNPRPFPGFLPSKPITIGSFQISFVAAFTILLSVVMMVGLTLFIKKTKMGKAMRAVSEDAGAAQLMGISVNTTISVTFAIGTALAAVAAVLYCQAYQQVEPLMGSTLGLRAFIAAVFGGIGILPGAMLGGMLMGIIESLTKAYVSTQLAEAVVYGVLIVVLIVKPTGLLGKKTSEKV